MKESETNSFLNDVVRGLSKPCKQIPSKYFYDDTGSAIFQEISQLREYYLPSCELEILEQQSADMLDCLASDELDVVELGCGDGNKTRILLQSFLDAGRTITYYPLDICPEILGVNKTHMRQHLPDLVVEPVVGDFFVSLEILRDVPRRKLVLFLGSNIGNYEDSEAVELLSRINSVLNPGDSFLMGADLVKDPHIILAAYDDSCGVTRRFNVNLLHRMNRELGANFDIHGFRHHAMYDTHKRAAVSFLVSSREQAVSLPSGEQFRFRDQERIHTEISRKYEIAEIDTLARLSGFATCVHFLDSREYYTVSLLSK